MTLIEMQSPNCSRWTRKKMRRTAKIQRRIANQTYGSRRYRYLSGVDLRIYLLFRLPWLQAVSKKAQGKEPSNENLGIL